MFTSPTFYKLHSCSVQFFKIIILSLNHLNVHLLQLKVHKEIYVKLENVLDLFDTYPLCYFLLCIVVTRIHILHYIYTLSRNNNIPPYSVMFSI